jgi:hypothetical protein
VRAVVWTLASNEAKAVTVLTLGADQMAWAPYATIIGRPRVCVGHWENTNGNKSKNERKSQEEIVVERIAHLLLDHYQLRPAEW